MLIAVDSEILWNVNKNGNLRYVIDIGMFASPLKSSAEPVLDV